MDGRPLQGDHNTGDHGTRGHGTRPWYGRPCHGRPWYGRPWHGRPRETTGDHGHGRPRGATTEDHGRATDLGPCRALARIEQIYRTLQTSCLGNHFRPTRISPIVTIANVVWKSNRLGVPTHRIEDRKVSVPPRNFPSSSRTRHCQPRA